MSEADILRELIAIRKLLESRGVPKAMRSSASPTFSTTKQERLLIANIANSNVDKKKIKKIKNPFKLEDIVESTVASRTRTKGIVKHIACKLALPSVKECDKTKCIHDDKYFVWVLWPPEKMIAYHFSNLSLMSRDDLVPRIGNELSGKVGDWVFDSKTREWERDGKKYSEEEFNNILYWDIHSKEDADDFLKSIVRLNKKR